MNQIFALAIKDLKILFRDKLGAFFVIGFPILMGLFFGLMMGNIGPSNGSSKMKVAIVDNDQTAMSEKFVNSLKANDNLELFTDESESAREKVRKGSAVGMVQLEKGFGDTVGIFFGGTPPEIKLGLDPSRGAEAAMIQGYIMQSVGSMMGERFKDPSSFAPSIEQARDDAKENKELDPMNRTLLLGFLGTVDSMVDSVKDLQEKQVGDETGQAMTNSEFEFANIQEIDITRKVDPKSAEGQLSKRRSKWDMSFPQAMSWGILGCVAGFSLSMVKERNSGTMTRLQASPLSMFQILAGKALACFLTVLLVIGAMTGLGVALGMQPENYLHLVIASVAVAFCFVGIMMTLSVVGKTEQSVSGIGWIANMIMAMLGGGMIPVMFMPGFIQKFSVISPIKWSILAIEGAIWRGFSLTEMLMPCAILVGVGIVGVVLGSMILSRGNQAA